MIRLGYVGLNTNLPSPNKIFRLSGYSEERMIETARNNINALKVILQWNRENNIHIFRLTSQLIPFGSHPINSGIWKKVLAQELQEVGDFVKKNQMKLSQHPGQYTVLNALNPDYFNNAIRDLAYHADVLELMGLDHKNRFVVHGGGAYGDKKASLLRLETRIKELPERIYMRLMIENDDVTFSAEEILNVCINTRIPAVLDTFHHEILPSMTEKSVRDIILAYKETWPEDERQKIQYSNQNFDKRKGSHSLHIDVESFTLFYSQIKDLELDIMLEVKDKEQSVLQLRNAIKALQ